MNIKQANAIPIISLLDQMGLKPNRQTGKEVWFLSPLRIEKTASFKVQADKNVWYDFGEGKGGDTVGFAVAFLQSRQTSSDTSDALRWISQTSNDNTAITFPHIDCVEKAKTNTLHVTKQQPIQHRLLIRYLDSRGITLPIAKNYLTELCVHNRETMKHFYVLGMGNEEEGYEVRNPFFKGCIGPKAISFLRGSKPKPGGIHIFEGMMDYLSVLEARSMPQLSEDTIILNSLSNLSAAFPYIKGYGYSVAYTWLDNDAAGTKAQKKLNEFLATQADMRHRPMNAAYQPHKDVNAWHMVRLNR